MGSGEGATVCGWGSSRRSATCSPRYVRSSSRNSWGAGKCLTPASRVSSRWRTRTTRPPQASGTTSSGPGSRRGSSWRSAALRQPPARNGSARTTLAALNDLRLVLGTRLGVTEETYIDENGPRTPGLTVYVWLTWLQGELVEALSEGL